MIPNRIEWKEQYMDKYQCFNRIKELLETHQCLIENHKEINYGIQFEIIREQQKGIFRIYQSKKGIRLDSSQIRDEEFRSFIDGIVKYSSLFPYNPADSMPQNKNTDLSSSKAKNHSHPSTQDPDRLIGVDESGKGDYFGPLVIAGVFTDEQTSKILEEAGVTDSKKINDKRIEELAELIKDICPYDIVVITNEKYNELYESIKNLNRLLAWGHARVIENLLELVDCDHALSDQFGRPELIQNALMAKGRQIHLEQRTKAEENIAVAAASILARNEFVAGIRDLESQYQAEFPKGASTQVINAAQNFVKRYGKDAIKEVAKVHFKITNHCISP